MSHYEERLQEDLERIRARVRQLGEAVISALQSSIQAVLSRDEGLAVDTIIGDLPINRRYRELDHRCHVFVARHLPSARHLRLVSAVLRLDKTLERIGDYAETISRSALQLTDKPTEPIQADIELMTRHAVKMLEQSLRAFDTCDEQLARDTRGLAGQYATTFDRVFSDLIREGESRTRPIADLFSLLAIFNRLERAIHQAKNICDQTVFVVTGKAKDEKTFDILFVDSRNAGASLLAERFARKAYRDSGSFQSAGWEVVDTVDPAYLEFAEKKGLYLGDAVPRQFDASADRLREFDFVIDLTGNAREHIPKVPFHTTLLSWPLENRSDPEAVYKQLSARIGVLMDRLRGDEED